MSSSATEYVSTEVSLNSRHMRRILASSFLGSTIEYYDFLLYATAAAVVFNKVFFTNLGPEMATFASFATLAVGYVSRPLGGVIFGHFGDRVGRKTVLVVSMMMMGAATVSIGLLPTTAQIGVLAPILLILLRIVQGISQGGEWGGAMLIALEHAPGGKRGFAASFANMGAPAGAILATLAVSAVSVLPGDQFQAWGWRLPFLFSIVLVAIGLVIRLKVSESPVFKKFEAQAESRKLPVVELFARHSKSLLLGTLAGVSLFGMAGIVTVWAVSFSVANGADVTGVLNAKAGAAAVMLITTIISARLCDVYGRKPVMMSGVIGMVLFAYPLLLLVQGGTVVGFLVAVMVGQALQGVVVGPFAAFAAELFPTRVRYTGASLCFQTASTIGIGFAPAVASALVLAGDGSITILAVTWTLVLFVSLGAIILTKEGKSRNLAELT
ncbi:MFS transporter [Arthrobacter sp. HS15c]|uniref:MFS transporter n=1 Tax=Arthrobacter sp. HS15c TaxID=3230279 RepID=UPI003467DF2A